MKKILESAWLIIREPSTNTSQVALAIAVISIATIVGCIVAFLYGIAARDCGLSCNLAGGLLAVISSAGAFSVGGLLGLLFGAPSFGGAAAQQRAPDSTAAESQKTGTTTTPSGIRPNTSLERIAEWLTTMMVGISLANLPTIEDRATQLGLWLTREITSHQDASNGSPGIVLALSFGFAGFLLVYLWSLRFLPSELRQSYADLSEKIDRTSEKADLLLAQLKEFKNKAIFKVPEQAIERHENAMRTAGVDAATCAEIRSRYEKAAKGADEPMESFGPVENSGYKLSVTVADQGADIYQFTGTLTPPVGVETGTCFWLLHNSFAPDVVSESPIKREGSLFQSTASEAFWIGAVVPRPNGEAIRLAFDLANAEGATEAFRRGGLPK